jgi:hypothetical protein
VLISTICAQRQLELSQSNNGPDAKKARWSPTQGGSPGNGSPAPGPGRDLFANYGYGPNANLGFPPGASQPGASGFAAPAGYNGGMGGQPALSLNTNFNGLGGGQQMSPAVASALNFPASAITQQQAAAMLQYNMLNMGMMNYPLSAGAFAPSQVRSCLR